MRPQSPRLKPGEREYLVPWSTPVGSVRYAKELACAFSDQLPHLFPEGWKLILAELTPPGFFAVRIWHPSFLPEGDQ